MKNLVNIGVAIGLLIVTACMSPTSAHEYCSLRAEALAGTSDGARKITVLLSGGGTLKISDEQRELEFVLFAKMLLAEKGVSESHRVAFALSILEAGMPRVLPRDDEAALCVENAQTVPEIDTCLRHIPSWRDTRVANPGECPVQ